MQSPMLSLQIFAGLIGCLMGFLYAISGFGDSGKVDDLAKNPRVRNVLWLFGGAVGIFFADWTAMAGKPIAPEDKGVLISVYSLAALGAVLLTLLGQSLLILSNAHEASRREAALRGRGGELVHEFLVYGFRAYRSLRDKLESAAAKQFTIPDALAALGTGVSVLAAATVRDREHADARSRDDLVDQALQAMESTVKLFAPGVVDLELHTNYMVRVSSDRLGGVSMRFAPGDLTDYDSFLVLRRYRDKHADSLCLPISKRGQGERVLPGAPAAAFFSEARLINAAKPIYETGVPPATRTEINTFFKQAAYKSVLSVPLVREREVVGVVNIESNHVDVVGKGPDMISRIGAALAPYTVVLGELVGRAEEAIHVDGRQPVR